MNYEQRLKSGLTTLLEQLKRQEQYELLANQLRMTGFRNLEHAIQCLELKANLN